MLTFYTFPKAPSPRRAEIALIEKGVAFESVVIDLTSGEHLGDGFKAINPSCTVPALRLENGHVLTDNHGILAYLDAEQPEPPLLGRTPEERAEIATRHARAEFEGLLAVAEVLRNLAPQMKDRALTGPVNYAQIPALAERGAQRLQAFWKVLDDRLEGRTYLAGEQFSAADIVALVATDFSKVVRHQPGEGFANIARWRAGLNERESVKRTNP